MKRSGFVVPSLALLAMASSAAWADGVCAHFDAVPINVSYDPLGAQASGYALVPVTLTATSYGEKQVHAEFADQETANPVRIGTGGPQYTLQSGGAAVVVPGTGFFNGDYAFHYRFNTTGRAEPVSGIQLIIDPGQDIAAGVYAESLDMMFRCSDPHAVSTQSAVLRMTVDVPSSLTASLAGGSATGTLDFGDFSSLSRTVQVNVYTTGPYSLSIVSDNAQKMKLVDGPSGTAGKADAEIGYTMTFNGAPASTAAVARFARTGVLGAHLPLTITAEPVGGKRAGVYHDTITLTFTPQVAL